MNQNDNQHHWIALECSPVEAQAWHVSADGAVLSKAKCALSADHNFEAQVIELIENWLPVKGKVDVLSCGWERSDISRFVTVPCTAFEISRLHHIAVRDQRIQLHDVGGVKQISPADVLRNDVLKIAGYLAQDPKFDGVICIPGHHSRWVRVSAEEIVSFESYMTGELQAHLTEKSSLRTSINETWSDAAFDDAVDEALSKPEKLAARLIGLQNDTLLNGLSGMGRSRLTGLLIGAEIASARPYWLGLDVLIMGDVEGCASYVRALQTQGAMARVADIREAALLGLSVARKAYIDQIR